MSSPQRTFLITGAASGIGRRFVTRLADRHRIWATDVDTEGLAEAADAEGWPSGPTTTAPLDVTEPEDWWTTVERIVDATGRLDGLIHAAGWLEPAYVWETGLEAIDRQVDINLKGTMYGTRIVGGRMVDQGSGHLINIGSLASLAPTAGMGIYSGTKFGVRGFTLAAARELEEYGVDVSLIMPDAVETPMLDKQADYEEAALSFSAQPLDVDDLADVLVDRVLPDRPLEVTVPATRGWMARATNIAPQLVRFLDPILRDRGEEKRRAYAADDDATT